MYAQPEKRMGYFAQGVTNKHIVSLEAYMKEKVPENMLKRQNPRGSICL
jgi:hypothetical protein